MGKYEGYVRVYTDGSKSPLGVGAAWSSDNFENTVKLNLNSSIFQAELYAIFAAIEFHTDRKIPKILICTDSLSALKAILKIKSNEPLVVKIRNRISSSPSKIALLWIPAHSGLTGNERADQLAKIGAALGEIRETGTSHTDTKKLIKKEVWEAFQRTWDEGNVNNKLGEIKPSVKPWKTAHLMNKKDEIVITRLRLGHTRITHEHLFERREVNKCICGENISVAHIFTCANLTNVRYRFSVRGLETLKCDDIESQQNVIKYIKAIKLYFCI